MNKLKKESGDQHAANEAQKLHRDFIERLKSFRVLDPACGSGNFLYVALRALKDLEHRANLDAEALMKGVRIVQELGLDKKYDYKIQPKLAMAA